MSSTVIATAEIWYGARARREKRRRRRELLALLRSGRHGLAPQALLGLEAGERDPSPPLTPGRAASLACGCVAGVAVRVRHAAAGAWTVTVRTADHALYDVGVDPDGRVVEVVPPQRRWIPAEGT